MTLKEKYFKGTGQMAQAFPDEYEKWVASQTTPDENIPAVKTLTKWEKLTAKMVYKWRVQSSGQWNTTLVSYIDARDVENRLDEALGPENWQNSYSTVNGQMLCNIGVWDSDKKAWIWKQDGGTESNIEKEKGLLSDSFKRAAVKWGVGRFLYFLKPYKLSSMKKLDTDGNPQKDYKTKKQVYVPSHDPKKYGPVANVPFGLVSNKGHNIFEIYNVNNYIWKHVKPYLENKNK